MSNQDTGMDSLFASFRNLHGHTLDAAVAARAARSRLSPADAQDLGQEAALAVLEALAAGSCLDLALAWGRAAVARFGSSLERGVARSVETPPADGADGDRDPEGHAAGVQESAAVREVLGRLPAREAAVLKALYLCHLSYADTAQAMGLRNVAAVIRVEKRAMRNARALLEARGVAP